MVTIHKNYYCSIMVVPTRGINDRATYRRTHWRWVYRDNVTLGHGGEREVARTNKFTMTILPAFLL